MGIKEWELSVTRQAIQSLLIRRKVPLKPTKLACQQTYLGSLCGKLESILKMLSRIITFSEALRHTSNNLEDIRLNNIYHIRLFTFISVSIETVTVQMLSYFFAFGVFMYFRIWTCVQRKKICEIPIKQCCHMYRWKHRECFKMTWMTNMNFAKGRQAAALLSMQTEQVKSRLHRKKALHMDTGEQIQQKWGENVV